MIAIPPIVAQRVLEACLTGESDRPQLGQVRALRLTLWPQSGQGSVMATLNHRTPCAVKRAGIAPAEMSKNSHSGQ